MQKALDYILVGILLAVVCGYGHAALSTDLLISGEALYDAPVNFSSGYMQDVTKAECAAVEVEQTKQLTDKRDGKKILGHQDGGR